MTQLQEQPAPQLQEHPAVPAGRRRVRPAKRKQRPAGCYERLLAGHFDEAGSDDLLPRMRSVGIVSCSSGEGSSTIARNLATCAAAEPGRRVLLVDANVSDPTVHRLFKVDLSPGLAELFSGSADPVVCVQPSDAENLSLVTAGTSRHRWWRRRRSAARAAGLVEDLQQAFSLVVVDLPAVAEPSCGVALAAMLDTVFLVVEAGRTRVEDARRAKRLLKEAGAHVSGVIVNKDSGPPPRSHEENGNL